MDTENRPTEYVAPLAKRVAELEKRVEDLAERLRRIEDDRARRRWERGEISGWEEK